MSLENDLHCHCKRRCLRVEFKTDGMLNRKMSRLNQKTSKIPSFSRAQGLLMCIIFSSKYRFTSFLSENSVGLQMTF